MKLLLNYILEHLETFIAIVVGFSVSLYFYTKSVKTKMPIYAIRTINLIRDNIRKISVVEILYSKNKINNLSITKIALWNGGKETINSDDVAPTVPVRVEIDKEYDILDAEILFQKNTANNFQIDIADDKKSITLSFDYFDYQEGVVLQMFHTGNDSNDIKISGKVKSVSKIKEILIDKTFKNRMRKMMGWFGIVLLISIYAIPSIAVNVLSSIFTGILPTFLIYIFSYVIFFIVFLLIVGISEANINRKTPKGFDVFEEGF